MATKYTVFNPEGEQYVSDVDRMNRQDAMLQQQLMNRQQAMRNEQAARQSRGVGRVSAPAPARNSGFVMVDGIPTPTNYTKLNIRGQRVADPEATRQAALESSAITRGTAADRSGYDIDAINARNAPAMEKMRLAQMLDERKWAAGASGREVDDLGNQLLLERMRGNTAGGATDVEGMGQDELMGFMAGGKQGLANAYANAQAKREAIQAKNDAIRASRIPTAGVGAGASILEEMGITPDNAQYAAEAAIDPVNSGQMAGKIQTSQRVQDVLDEVARIRDRDDSFGMRRGSWESDDMADIFSQFEEMKRVIQNHPDFDKLTADDKQALINEKTKEFLSQLEQPWTMFNPFGTEAMVNKINTMGANY